MRLDKGCWGETTKCSRKQLPLLWLQFSPHMQVLIGGGN